MKAKLVGVLGSIMVATACGEPTADEAPCGGPAPFRIELVVRDESGHPLSGAEVQGGAGPVVTRADGVASLGPLTQPVALVVRKDGFLAEPVVVGPTDEGARVEVQMLGDAGGKRWVMHSVGDVMMGRRYEEPVSGAALVPKSDVEGGARRVVAAVRGVYAAADVRTLNLETVVTDRAEAYPGKRFILRTRPGALAGLADLEPDAIGLANNHQRDFLDVGVGDTLAALRSRGLHFTGASSDVSPSPSLRAETRGARVSVLAFTTVDGDFVNDSYPSASTPPPPTLDPKDAFQYSTRTWGFSGAQVDIPAEPRRIGAAWTTFLGAVKGAPPEGAAGAWGSLAAVYPEMQDWVQRRGHGGAQPWDDVASPSAIAKAHAAGDVVVVQLHAGFQFQEAPGRAAVAVAKRAIDAGADIVIGHHPHVLQGLGYYKGKLIAFSLGNFVFDQDFLSTFASVMLRTVWEGTNLVQARLVPVEIDGYVPRPATGVAGRRTLLRVWERSVSRARSDRDATGAVRAYAFDGDDGVIPAQLVIERSSARVVSAAPRSAPLAVTVPARSIAPIPVATLCRDDLGGAGAGTSLGRDLLGWGRFEPELVGTEGGGAHWKLGSEAGACRADVAHGAAATGRGYLHLARVPGDSISPTVRPVSRVPIYRHRTHSDAGAPLDADPSFSVRAAIRRVGTARAFVKAVLYHFDDTNPTEDPESDVVGTVELELPEVPAGGFSTVDLPVDAPELGPSGRANMVLLYVGFDHARGDVALDVDDLAFVEWRPASKGRGIFGHYDFVRNDGPAARAMSLPCLGL